jgi:hypothetical protein
MSSYSPIILGTPRTKFQIGFSLIYKDIQIITLNQPEVFLYFKTLEQLKLHNFHTATQQWEF